MENIIINKEEYSKACKEVLEILKNIKDEDLKKIPNKEIEKLKQNANVNHEFTYDSQKNIKEQNVSKLSKAIIANLFIEYIATTNQKQKILDKQKYDLQLLEQEKLKKYNTNNILKSKKADNSKKSDSTKLPIEIKRETFFGKIFKFIKRIFNL